MASATNSAPPTLSATERSGIVLAVNSAFLKLKNLYDEIVPTFQSYGFTPPSAGVIARDLSEKIETSIVQHCRSFSKGSRHCDLSRLGQEWEVKICKGTGLTINQSKIIRGENYIVVNYRPNSTVKEIWVLWKAQDHFFSPRKVNSNARTINRDAAKKSIETLYSAQSPAEDQPPHAAPASVPRR